MKRNVIVTQIIEVEIDESKFTPAFMIGFNETIFDADLDDHLEHLGQLYARGIADDFSSFIEGYGPPTEMGIKFRHRGQEVDSEDI